MTAADLGFPDTDDERTGLTLNDPVRAVADLATADLGRRPFLSTAVYSVLALGGTLTHHPQTVPLA